MEKEIYELIEIDTMMGHRKGVGMGSDLDAMVLYATKTYSSNNDPEYDKVIEDRKNENALFTFINRGGQYQGSGYKPHAVIRKVKPIISFNKDEAK